MKIKNRMSFNLIKVRGRSSLMSRKVYSRYVKRRQVKDINKSRSKRKEMFIYKRDEFFRFGSDFFKVIADNLPKIKGGIYLKNFGYFCVFMKPRKSIYKNRFSKKEYYNFHTDQRVYLPIFHGRGSTYSWSMDYTFSSPIKREIRKSLESGNMYKNYLYTFNKNNI